MNSPRRSEQGFTLVELLIVVIILAIMSAIAIPQFSSSTEDAKVSSLETNLAELRADKLNRDLQFRVKPFKGTVVKK